MPALKPAATLGVIGAIVAVASVAWFIAAGPSSAVVSTTEARVAATDAHVPGAVPNSATASRPRDLVGAVRSADRWPVKAQVPGVESSRLSTSLEDWILSLPADRQDAARRFAARYAPAYDVDDKAVQAWMLEMGFPSLEEFAAFDYGRDTATCSPRACRDPNVAALSSDHLIERMEEILPPGVMESKTSVDVSLLLSDAQNEAMMGAYTNAASYVARVRESGNVILAAYLQGRLELAMGNPDGASASRIFIAACGDRRMTLTAAEQALVGIVAMSYGTPCNNAGRPPFPDVDLSAQLAGE
jgi:hypothetical protein